MASRGDRRCSPRQSSPQRPHPPRPPFGGHRVAAATDGASPPPCRARRAAASSTRECRRGRQPPPPYAVEAAATPRVRRAVVLVAPPPNSLGRVPPLPPPSPFRAASLCKVSWASCLVCGNSPQYTATPNAWGARVGNERAGREADARGGGVCARPRAIVQTRARRGKRHERDARAFNYPFPGTDNCAGGMEDRGRGRKHGAWRLSGRQGGRTGPLPCRQSRRRTAADKKEGNGIQSPRGRGRLPRGQRGAVTTPTWPPADASSHGHGCRVREAPRGLGGDLWLGH